MVDCDHLIFSDARQLFGNVFEVREEKKGRKAEKAARNNRKGNKREKGRKRKKQKKRQRENENCEKKGTTQSRNRGGEKTKSIKEKKERHPDLYKILDDLVHVPPMEAHFRELCRLHLCHGQSSITARNEPRKRWMMGWGTRWQGHHLRAHYGHTCAHQYVILLHLTT